MTLSQVKSIYDVIDYFDKNSTGPSASATAVTLVATYGDDVPEGVLCWDVWRRDYTKNERYPFIDGGPHLMMYRQKKVGTQLYSAGIVFPLRTDGIIEQVSIDKTKNEIKIAVNNQAFYWQYNRQQAASIKRIFANFNDADFDINAAVTQQMDSQTPSHGGTQFVGVDE